MAWGLNILSAASVTTATTSLTFAMVDQNGTAVTTPGTMQIKILGSGLTYNATTGAMAGTITSVQIFNSSTSTALQTLAIDTNLQSTLAANISTFLAHSLTFQSQLSSWGVLSSFHHFGTQTDISTSAGLTSGSVLKVAVHNSSNAIVNYLKVTGTTLYPDSQGATGTVTKVELLDASGNSYASPKVADYTALNTAGTPMMLDEIAYGGHVDWDALWGVMATNPTLDGGVVTSNTLTVAASNTLDIIAGIGNETITGTAGIDTLNFKYATGAVDVDLSRTANHATFNDNGTFDTYTYQISGIENLTGSKYRDALTGNSAANVLYGGVDNVTDYLEGAGGNDTYLIYDNKDAIIEHAAGGTDTVYAYANFANFAALDDVENMVLLGTATDATGNAANNVLTGNGLANNLDGGTGADTMTGGDGNDTYTVDNANDVVIETTGALSGTDTVIALNSYALAATAQVEILKTEKDTNFDAINLTGSNIANVITGNSGGNILDGGSAGGDGVTDSLNGLLGDDTYVLGGGDDTVVDTGGTNDTITSSISRSLANYTGADATKAIENLILTGSANVDATGNQYDNKLTGNTGNNILTGGDGKDELIGGAGNDTFVWDAKGKDTIDDFRSTYFNVTLSAASVAGAPASSSTATGSGTVTLNLAQNRVDLDVTTTGLDWLLGHTTSNAVASFGFYQGASGANGAVTHDILTDTKKVVYAPTQRVTDVWTTATGLTAALVTNITSNGHYLQIKTVGSNAAGAAGDIRGQMTALAGTSDVISVESLKISDYATIQELAATFGTTNTVITRNYNTVAHQLTLNNVVEADLQASYFKLSTDTADDNVTGTAGNDDLFGGLGNDTLTGAAGTDRLFGEAGNDYINGGLGSDRMFGGLGNDTYVIDVSGDYINDTGGNDTVLTDMVNFSVLNFSGIENFGAFDTGLTTANKYTGNKLANTITGNAGNNYIDGVANTTGTDAMNGGAGNDTYIVNAAGDTITDSAGTDTVLTKVSYTLAAGLAIETLGTFLSTGNFNLTGNALAQKIQGNSGNNILNGGAGNDTIVSGGGSDSIVFNTALNAATNKDTVTDFISAYDTFKLENSGVGLFNALGAGTLAATRFYVGAAAHDADDRIIYNKTTGTLYYDKDGTGAAASVAFAVLTSKPTLTNADFVII